MQPADVDERVRADEDPETYVRRVALDKARVVAQRHATVVGETAVVLGADTAVVLDGIVLGKPLDAADAVRMLEALAGRTHAVFTGVAVIDAGGRASSAAVRTTVGLRTLDSDEIRAYVETGEPLDKAGAYAIQGGASAFVNHIEGSWTNVVGLPMDETLRMLAGVGIRPDLRPAEDPGGGLGARRRGGME